VDDNSRHVLRTGFDRAAGDYQRTRPVCPPGLFDDLMRLAGLAPGDRVAEIGCGTGQATVPLAERGLAVTAIELGPALAALARRRLAGFPAAEVVTAAFEDWAPAQTQYDTVIAVNSLHWIDPSLRYAKPHAVLAPGGTLAVAGCQWARPADTEPFWADVQADYQAVGFAGDPPPPPEQIGPWHLPSEAGALFSEIAGRRYPFQLRYHATDYLAQLASLGRPDLTATFVGYLTLARRR
jgi:SAM-dependent methyltransferase